MSATDAKDSKPRGAADNGDRKSRKPVSAERDDYIPKPDRTEFTEGMKSLRAELDAARAKLQSAKTDIEKSSAANKGPSSPEEMKLREEHTSVLQERNRLRETESKTRAEADKIEEGMKRKLNELRALRPKNGPRNVKELDAQVQQLEASVEGGQLSIVEENKLLKEVTSLKKQRVAFAQADKLQAEIDELRKQVADTRKRIDTAAAKSVQQRKAELEKQLDAFKQDKASHRKKLDGLFDQRRAAQAEVQRLNTAMDKLRADFDKKMDDFRKKLQEQKTKREAEEKAAKAATQKQKQISEAQAKVDAAKAPAFGAHISKAEQLLAYFHPQGSAAAPAAAGADADASSVNAPRASVSKAVKAQTAPQGAKPLEKPLAASGADAVPVSRKEAKQRAKDAKQSQSGKVSLDVGIVEALSSLNIAIPTHTDNLDEVKDKLREKIAYYKEHTERVTQERVERAEKHLQEVRRKVEAEEAKAEEAKEAKAAKASKSAAEKAEKATAEKATAEKAPAPAEEAAPEPAAA